MNEGNIAAEVGVEAGVSFVEKNDLGTITTKELILLEDLNLKPYQATEKGILYLPMYFLH